MTVASYEKTSLGWQVQQLQQRVGEWIDWQLSQWFNQPDTPAASLPNWLQSLIGFLEQAFEVIAWSLIALITFLVLWLVYQLVMSYQSRPRTQGSQIRQAAQPPATELSVNAWLRRSQEFQRQGNYREACRALYMGMLQQLHELKIAPHQLGRTDGEYLQVVQTLTEPEPYELLINTHEQLWFGDGDASQELVNQCQQAFQNISSEVRP